MSFLLKCNVFPVLYRASRRGLPYNIHNLTRRSIALGCKMKQESEPNHLTIPHEKINTAILNEYLKVLQTGHYSPLVGMNKDVLLKSVRDAKKSGNISTMSVSLLLKYCGDVAVNIRPAKRSQYLHQIWKLFTESDVPLDVSHYNVFLKSRIENEEKIDFEEFIEQMKSKNVTPNRVTYQHFLTNYCYHGELGAATKVLEIMKANDIPLNEHIFNALILGHSVANDTAGADDIFRIMKEKNLNITSATYFMYLSGLARSGNIIKLTQVLEECSSNGIDFSLEMKFDIIYHLIMSGHKDFAFKMLAEEIRSGARPSVKHEFLLLYRLLHKKETDALVDLVTTFFEKNDMRQRLWLAYCYILYNEGILPLCKFYVLCEGKHAGGMKKNVRELVRHYKPGDHDSLERLAGYCKTTERPPNFIFLPFLKESLHLGNMDLSRMVGTLRVMKDCGVVLNSYFLKEFVVSQSGLSLKHLPVVVDLLRKAGLARAPVLGAFLMRAVEKGDLDFTEGILKEHFVPRGLSIYKDTLGIAVTRGHTDCVAACFKFWYFKNILSHVKIAAVEPETKPETEPETVSQTVSLTEEEYHEYADSIATIVNRPDAGSPYDILQELANMGVPLPAKVIASIKASWLDEETRDLIDNLQTPQVTLADARNSGILLARFDKDRGRRQKEEEIEDREESEEEIRKSKKQFDFEALVLSGNITEAMKQLDTDEEVNTYSCYSILARELVKCGDDEKVRDVIERFVKTPEAMESGMKDSRLYLEREMLNQKMFSQFHKSCTKRLLIFNRRRFDYLSRSMESLDENDLGAALSVWDSPLLNSARRWLLCSFKENKEDLAFKMLSKRRYGMFFNTIKYEVLPFLCGVGRLDTIEKILAVSDPNKSRYSLDFILQLCSGDLSAFRSNKVPSSYDFVRFVGGIGNVDVKGRIIEKLLEPGVLNEYKSKNILYQILLENYEMKGVNPEKCLELWYKQQEENLGPTNMFLVLLADILKKNDIPPQFHVPNISPPELRDAVLTHRSFPGYLNHELNSLKNDETQSDRVKRLFRLVREKILHFNQFAILRRLWKDNAYMLGLLEDAIEPFRLRSAFSRSRDVSKYLTERGITTRESFNDHVNTSFLASLYLQRGVNKTLSSVFMWFYWSRVNPVPELVEMVKLENVTPETREMIANSSFVFSKLKSTQREQFYDFLRENRLFVDRYKDRSKMSWLQNWRAPYAPYEKMGSSFAEEEGLFEKDRFGRDFDLDDTETATEGTGAPGLGPRT